jgi:hypothetical protein
MMCSQCHLNPRPAATVSTCNHTRFDSWCDECFVKRNLNDIFPQCTKEDIDTLESMQKDRKQKRFDKVQITDLTSKLAKLRRENTGGFDYTYGAKAETESDLIDELDQLSKRTKRQASDTELHRQQLESIYDYLDD